MDYKKSRKLSMVLSLTGLGSVLIGLIIQLLELQILLIIGGFILLAYSQLNNYRHNRCPSCGGAAALPIIQHIRILPALRIRSQFD